MSIEGRIAVDVSFADSATSAGVQSLKKISLVDTTSYTTGKIRALTGTVGTASVVFQDLSYRDAAGNLVTSITALRIALQATPGAQILNDLNDVLMQSNGDISVDSFRDHVVLKTTAGTASYTLVLYGT